jgi:ParB/RepB/Spo0J family partition protein
MQDDIRIIPVTDLIDPPLVLREVNQRGLEYTELRDSIRKHGLLNSICVRPSLRKPGMFEIVDGRWRVSVARDVGLVGVPCIVKFELTDKDVLAMQVIANATRPTTLRSDFARQIRRLLSSEEGMTQAEVCQLLNKGPHWVRKMLGMAALSRYLVYRKVIDRGELTLEAAYHLARLPRELWKDYLVEAQVLPLREFKALCMTILREFRAKVQAGTITKRLTQVEPQPFIRSLSDLLDEIRNQRSGPLVVVASSCKTPLDGWNCALKWSVHLDFESVERQRQRVQKRLKKRIVKRRIKSPACFGS